MHSEHHAIQVKLMQASFIVIFVPLFFNSVIAQLVPNLGTLSVDIPVSTGRYALDVPVDPRSIAMGESFVAVEGTPSAYIYNPASLATLQGFHISYNYRSDNFVNPIDAKYRLFAATLPTPFVNIGAFYSRFNYDDNVPITTPSTPAGTGGSTITMHDYVFGITLARTLNEHVRVGITGKTFNSEMTFGSPFQHETNHPILFDAGVQYSITGVLANSLARDQIEFGVSLQNFGTDARQGTLNLGNPDQLLRLPRYLRTGFAYSFSMSGENKNRPKLISFLLTTEYRNLLNGKESQSDDRDFWGYGCEASFFEIVSLRLGGYISPLTSPYGNRGTAAARYGFGLCAPIKYLIPNVPLTISIDYAVIPVNNVSLFNRNSSLQTFAFEAHYNQEFF